MKVRKEQTLSTNLHAANFGKFVDSRAYEAWHWHRLSGPETVEVLEEARRAIGGDASSVRDSQRLNGLKYLEEAMNLLDASFFRQLADFIDFLKRGKPNKLARAEFAKYILREQRKIEARKRSALREPITRHEVKQHLDATVPGGISERNFDQIVADFGYMLEKAKPGPKPTQKVRK